MRIVNREQADRTGYKAIAPEIAAGLAAARGNLSLAAFAVNLRVGIRRSGYGFDAGDRRNRFGEIRRRANKLGKRGGRDPLRYELYKRNLADKDSAPGSSTFTTFSFAADQVSDFARGRIPSYSSSGTGVPGRHERLHSLPAPRNPRPARTSDGGPIQGTATRPSPEWNS